MSPALAHFLKTRRLDDVVDIKKPRTSLHYAAEVGPWSLVEEILKLIRESQRNSLLWIL